MKSCNIIFFLLLVLWFDPSIAWCDHERDPFNGAPIPHPSAPEEGVPGPGPLDKFLLKPNLQKPNTLDQTGRICSGITATKTLERVNQQFQTVLISANSLSSDFNKVIVLLAEKKYDLVVCNPESRREWSNEESRVLWTECAGRGFGELVSELLGTGHQPMEGEGDINDGYVSDVRRQAENLVSELDELGQRVSELKNLCQP